MAILIEILRRLGPVKFVTHIIWRLAEIVLGWLFLSRLGQYLWRLFLYAAQPSSAPSPVATAMFAHVYYPELLDEVLALYRCLPADAALHVTAPASSAARISSRLAALPRATLYVRENRGRDIAPFLSLLTAGVFAPYQAVLRVHTKRSPHLINGNMRRRLLFTLLAGNPMTVNRVLSQFEAPQTGIVGLGWSFRRGARWWLGSQVRGEQLCRAMKPPAEPEAAFFEGSMFWFRPAALEPLRSLQLTANDFEHEEGQTDGALHHVVERLFTLAARAAGFETRSLTNQRLL